MTERSVEHATFVIDRHYDALPSAVFDAWSSSEAKLAWFACDDAWKVTLHELDFRPGGRELLRTGAVDGPVHEMDARYHDIVEGERIVYSYAMRVGEPRISVSLVTITFEREGEGTRMIFTEQGAFLDGLADAAEREEGTRVGLENLARILDRS